MALIQTNFYSKALSKVTEFNLLLPNDCIPEMVANNECYNREMKYLVLLHGYSGNHKDWLLRSYIQNLSEKYNLAVIMPTGDNSFYLDGKATGSFYAQYVGNELLEYTKKTFGLSLNKKDTYIGGYSMGGFGAIHTGLLYSNNYSKIFALSSALIIHNIKNITDGFQDMIANYDYYAATFGDLNALEASDNNPEHLIRVMKKEGGDIPPIYMACGTEDFLIEENRRFIRFLQDETIDAVYKESHGGHDWEFWNTYLEPAIQWLLV